MSASEENVAVFGDFRYKLHSLGNVVSSRSRSWCRLSTAGGAVGLPA
jgi:hypothetical protein